MTSVFVIVVVSLLHVSDVSTTLTPVSSAMFTSTTVSLQTWGVRAATSTCLLSFPGINIPAADALVVVRFEVRATSFTSTSSYNDDLHVDASYKWLVARVDVVAFNTLTYMFTYEYSEYLGTRAPTGDCRLFSNDTFTMDELWTEVVTLAGQQPHLTATEDDRRVSSAGFTLLFTPYNGSLDELRARCQVQLPPQLTLGQYEVYILVNFTLPVYGGSSLFNTVIVEEDIDNTWFLGRRSSHAIGYVDEELIVHIPKGSVDDYNAGYCSVYAISNDTLDVIISRLHGGYGTTTPVTLSSLSTSQTSPGSTTTDTHTPRITLSSTGGAPSTIETTSHGTTPSSGQTTSVTGPSVDTTSSLCTSITTTTSQTSVIPGLRRILKEVPGMRTQMLCNASSLWSRQDSNPLTCGRQCVRESDCASVFYISDSNLCHAHDRVYTVGNCTEMSSSYFVVV